MAQIAPGTNYPPQDHPSGYYFSYENGRYLSEYQVNYDHRRRGHYENSLGQMKIAPGSLVITCPGEWHRYRPLKSSGWKEHYVGFAGVFAEQIFAGPWFAQKDRWLNLGHREDVLDSYCKIFQCIQQEKPGYQQVAAGIVMRLLGHIVSIDKQKGYKGKRIEKVIQNACFAIRENLQESIDFEEFARENGMGYSYFRKMFKKYMGMPPVQYHLDLKVHRAKEMLMNTDKSIKEISYELGFKSIYYFSRIFKSKQGVSPSEIRKMLGGNPF
ncbi:MAG: AraC family transcriptional regulator [Bacteroidales bacterium]